MIKSANEFKKQVENIVLPGSSIGVYDLSFVNNSEIIAREVTSIFYNGISNRRKEHIINSISIYGTTNDWGYREIFYSIFPEMIIAIPEVLKAFDGNMYYLGNFDSLDIRKHEFHERDNGYIKKLWFYDYMNHVQVLPREFILGAKIYDDKKQEASFILNPNYIGFCNEKNQDKVASDIFRKYPNALKDVGIRRINEDSIEKDYYSLCQELEQTTSLKNTFYLKQYKEYFENNYPLLSQKRK